LAVVKRKFYIAMTSRTGSTLLSEELIRYGVLAGEYFSLGHVRKMKEEGIGDYGELCAHYASTQAPNGTFGAKGTLQMLMPLFLAGEFPATLPQWKFVYTTRDNLIRQAISIVIAAKTDAWDSRAQKKQEVTDADYSGAEIANQLRSIVQGQAWLEFFFASYGIKPLRTSFEKIVANPKKIAEQVAKYCGLNPNEEFARREATQPLESQSTDLNVEWESRFRREGKLAAL
jgi:LPS sulfotransferase NodH